MDLEIVTVDKRYRRNLFLAYLGLILLGVVFWNGARPALLSWVESLPNKQRVETIETLEHLVLLLFIPAALYLVNVGRKICRFGAVPYPGMRVIHDTVVVRGKKALRRGRSLVILGIVMIVMVVMSMVVNHYLMLKFKNHPLIRPVFYGTEV